MWRLGCSAVRSHLHLCLCQLSPSSLKVGSNDHYSEDEQHKRGKSRLRKTEGGGRWIKGGEERLFLSLMCPWWKAARLMSLLKLASVSWINFVITHRRLSLESQHSLVINGAMLPLWLRGMQSYFQNRVEFILNILYWIKLFWKLEKGLWMLSNNLNYFPCKSKYFEDFIELSITLSSSC